MHGRRKVKNTMTKYIFLDIDGTLYSPKTGSTPPSAEKALKIARGNGHKIFLCTGRSLAEIVKYLDYDVDGLIMGAGGMIYVEKKRVYNHPIPKEDVTKIKSLIDQAGLGYSLEGSAGAYCSQKGYEALLKYFAGGSNDRDEMIRKANENCTYTEEHGNEETDQIYKICAFGSDWEKDYLPIIEKLPKPYIMTQSMSIPEEHFCIGEVTNENVSKATGIQLILKHYGASKEDAIGIGDSANDIPMFSVVNDSIAMGNGTPETKAAANWVTTDILDDGILNAFLHTGVIQKDQL